MKKVKMVQVFFILICLASYLVGSAQSDYIVTTKNDTLRGKVKYLNFDTGKKLQLITADGKKEIYLPETLRAQIDGESYVPIHYEEKLILMKILKSGYLSLYAYQPPRQQSWGGRYMLTKDNRRLELPSIGFKRMMTKYLMGCPELTPRIESKELQKEDINEIVDLYNACIGAAARRLLMNKETTAPLITSSEWDKLEATVQQLDASQSKTDALEMIKEIKLKISHREIVPNFILEGLKNALKDYASTTETLNKAIQSLKH